MWNLLAVLLSLLMLSYCSLIIYYTIAFKKLTIFKASKNIQPATTFTIIIPARNEAENIEHCIASILHNDYPQSMFEVIVVDDFSIDNTVAIVEKLSLKFKNIRIIKLADEVHEKINSYKKKAIELAVHKANHEWILTTDADCIVPPKWLQTFDALIQEKNPVFVAAPVVFKNTYSVVSIFQCLDFLTLQGITAASVSAGFHSMCNGANLSYKKSVFYSVNGFKGVDNIASGDDMLLMHKIKQMYPASIQYLFSQHAIVSTLPMQDWKSFFNQRIRWASKSTSYKDKKIFRVLMLVYLLNLFLFALPFLAVFQPVYLVYWLILLSIKTICEFVFIWNVATFFRQRSLLKWFAIMQPVHIVYTVISGFLGVFGKYQWKGRSVS